jgi:hypothetical protein
LSTSTTTRWKRYEPGEEAPSAAPPGIANLGALTPNDQGRSGTVDASPKSLKVARTFDSIGRRNEGLRTHLDSRNKALRESAAKLLK